MLVIIGAIMLWFRPSWGFLGVFTLGLAIISALLTYLRNSGHPDLEGYSTGAILLATAIDVSLNVVIFAALGALIVKVRGGKIEPKTSEAEIDAELARIRAQNSAKDDSASR